MVWRRCSMQLTRLFKWIHVVRLASTDSNRPRAPIQALAGLLLPRRRIAARADLPRCLVGVPTAREGSLRPRYVRLCLSVDSPQLRLVVGVSRIKGIQLCEPGCRARTFQELTRM